MADEIRNTEGMVIPKHIAFVMDGNRRYAQKSMFKMFGHKEGGKKFEEVLDWCMEMGVPQISFYVLSTENLSRPKRELDEIMDIAFDFLEKWARGESIFDRYEVNVRFVGDLKRLPPRIVRLMGKIMQKTAKYNKKVLNMLVAYGSKFELTHVMRKIAENVLKTGRIEVTEKEINKNLLVKVPVDLVIRTGGMSRLSNFLLWQSAYAEFYMTKTLWPEFDKKEFVKAVEWYNSMQKNVGR